jgi:putative hydrolases of HD superfamily
MKGFIDFFNTIEKLKRVKRAGWAREGVPDSESVADHSFGTALLCYMLADDLKVNKDKLVRMALVHDLAEEEAGDIVSRRGTKTVYSLNNKFRAEKKVMTKLFSNIKNGAEYVNLWLEFEEGKTREAIILKQIDKLEMVFQALDYEKDIDASKLDEFWDDARTTLKEPFLIKIFDELEKRRKNKK